MRVWVRLQVSVCVCVCVCARVRVLGVGQGWGLSSEALISKADRRVGALGGRPWDVPARCLVFSQPPASPAWALLCQIPGRLAREPVSLLPSEWGPGGEARKPRLTPRRPLLPRGSV